MKNKILNYLFYGLIFTTILLACSAYWVHNTFGLINFDSLLYTMTNGLEGTEAGMINGYILYPLSSSIAIIISLIHFNKFFKKNYTTYLPYIIIDLFNRIRIKINILRFVY